MSSSSTHHNNNTTTKVDDDTAAVVWHVHKFGGTSVATADCFRQVACIIQSQLLSTTTTTNDDDCNRRLAIVVSAVGGQPKTTDLLHQTVQAAATRDTTTAPLLLLQQVRDRHLTICQELFSTTSSSSSSSLLFLDTIMNRMDMDLKIIQQLLSTVSLLKWPAVRLTSIVAGYGELWSTLILQQLLLQQQQQQNNTDDDESGNQNQNQFTYVDARNVITVMDEGGGEDDPEKGVTIAWKESQDKLDALLLQQQQQQQHHLVMTGYIAVNTAGVACTLRRDGSDYSAAILGKLLHAESVTIWTDVTGVLSADPRLVPAAHTVPTLSYQEAMELAYFGAKVMHPQTMQPCLQASPPIPIYIRNTFRPTQPGTCIAHHSSSSNNNKNDSIVCGFTSINHMALINVEGSGLMGVRGSNRRVFSALEQAGCSVVLVSQASSEHSVTLAVSKQDSETACTALREEFRTELDRQTITAIDETATECSIIAAVGDGMSSKTGVAGLFFTALGQAKINVLAIAQGSSERNISAVVPTRHAARALRAVHAAFLLGPTLVRVAAIVQCTAAGTVDEMGTALLRLLETKRQTLQATFGLDLRVVTVVLMDHQEGERLVTLASQQQKEEETLSCSMTVDDIHQALQQTGTDVDSSVVAKLVPAGGLSTLFANLRKQECTNHVIFDCTSGESVAAHHASWLRSGADVVTANNTGMSGPMRDEIAAAERPPSQRHSKAGEYLRGVTVGGGLPIINTARTLLETGDKIRRVDGIFSVSMSYIMFRVSPPANIDRCSKFDEEFSNGIFKEDLLASGNLLGEPCSFSQALKEAVALGLMEDDVTKDVGNEYTARVLMVLARELGILDQETKSIQEASEKLVTEAAIDNVSPAVDKTISDRVAKARSRGCVLRQVSSIGVAEGKVQIQIVEVPEHHVFAVSPPTCVCVRFFTHQHERYPLIVQGPSAGVESTASALLADFLLLMKGRVSSSRAVTLTRTNTSASLVRQQVVDKYSN